MSIDVHPLDSGRVAIRVDRERGVETVSPERAREVAADIVNAAAVAERLAEATRS